MKFVSGVPKLAERNQPFPALVPQGKPHAAEAFPECKPSHLPQFGMIKDNPAQAIERNACIQVVHVVYADIGRDPAKRCWQVIV